jgi:hypothetical protein
LRVTLPVARHRGHGYGPAPNSVGDLSPPGSPEGGGPAVRRASIKARLVNFIQAAKRSTRTHLRYLERDGTTPDGERGRASGAIDDTVDTEDFEIRGRATILY